MGPVWHLEFVGFIAAGGDSIGEFFGPGDDVIASKDNAESVGVSELGVSQTGGMEGQLASGDTHFDFAAHDFLVFLDGPLKVFFQGAEFGDIAGEAGGLATEFARDDIQWEAR